MNFYCLLQYNLLTFNLKGYKTSSVFFRVILMNRKSEMSLVLLIGFHFPYRE